MGLGHWDREALLERYRERLWEAERERRLLPLRRPWRVRLAQALWRLAQALAPEERWEVARGG
ncbi:MULTISPECIES: hypothetical protein [Thermus]|uniref:hypothetical protein n=1 Tax=Thermus TaxID=270 RepID=UPI001F22B0AB|nr:MULTISPECIES: hypothetical protein [Thermus]